MKKKRFKLVFLMSLLFYSHGESQKLIRTELPDHSPYVGKWVGTIDEDSLIVNLKLKDFYFAPVDKSFKILYGTYEYISNSSIDREPKQDLEYPIRRGIINDKADKKYIGFTFMDEVLVKAGQLRLYIDEKNDDKLEWHLFYGEGIYVNTTKAEIEERRRFSVPTEMTLYRVE